MAVGSVRNGLVRTDRSWLDISLSQTGGRSFAPIHTGHLGQPGRSGFSIRLWLSDGDPWVMPGNNQPEKSFEQEVVPWCASRPGARCRQLPAGGPEVSPY